MNKGQEILARVHVRCANEACNLTWWEGPKNGRTIIGKCPSCSHSTVVVLSMEEVKTPSPCAEFSPHDSSGRQYQCTLPEDHDGSHEARGKDGPIAGWPADPKACRVRYALRDKLGFGLCSKNRGHVGEHGALFGPCTLCDDGKNVQQPFNKPCPDCGRYWEARCDARAEQGGRFTKRENAPLICRKVKGHAWPHEWEPVDPVSSETVADVTWPDARAERGVGSLSALVQRVIDNFVANRMSPEYIYSKHARMMLEVIVRDAYEAGLAKGSGMFEAPDRREPSKFDTDLEKHRKAVLDITELDVLDPHVRAIAHAVWFLLAVTHQP